MSLIWKQDAVLMAIGDGADEGVANGAHLVLDEGNRLVRSPPKTGRIYTTRFFTIGRGAGRRVIPYGSRAPHQASAPGEAPANDTGALIASGRVTAAKGTYAAFAGWQRIYAFFLEFGTDRMEPRPFIRRALMAMADNILLSVGVAIERRL